MFVLLIGTGGGEIQESTNTFERCNQQLDIMSFEIIDQILNTIHGSLRLYDFEFGEFANILEISTSLIIDYEIGIDIFSEFLILREDGLEYLLLDIFELLCDYGCYSTQEWSN